MPCSRGSVGYRGAVTSEARGPDPSIEQLVVVITTGAFEATLAFYRDVVGMEVIEEWTEAGHGAVLSAGGCSRLELIDLPERGPITGESLFIGLQVHEIDGLYERAEGAGCEIVRPPAERPWGGRGFVVRDPSGVAVNIYTAYDSPRS